MTPLVLTKTVGLLWNEGTTTHTTATPCAEGLNVAEDGKEAKHHASVLGIPEIWLCSLSCHGEGWLRYIRLINMSLLCPPPLPLDIILFREM